MTLTLILHFAKRIILTLVNTMIKKYGLQNIEGRNKALYLYKNHFFLKWKRQSVRCNQVIHELKVNFKLSD